MRPRGTIDGGEFKVTFPRLTLGTYPTPLQPLKRLSERLGLDVWIKRDDLTGFAMGGNKVREAEFTLADALRHGADVVLTAGTSQSNHAHVIAAAARQLNIECHLFVFGRTSEKPTGNLLLDYLAWHRENLNCEGLSTWCDSG